MIIADYAFFEIQLYRKA